MAVRGTTSPRPAPAPQALPPPQPAADNGAFATLEARGPSIAPGMRVMARLESRGEKTELVRAEQHDTCVRVAFQAAAPVVAKLIDGTNGAVATTGASAVEGVLGEKGPVCIRKGDTLSGMVEGDAGAVRWVAWGTP